MALACPHPSQTAWAPSTRRVRGPRNTASTEGPSGAPQVWSGSSMRFAKSLERQTVRLGYWVSLQEGGVSEALDPAQIVS
jgi:hypothetical protein